MNSRGTEQCAVVGTGILAAILFCTWPEIDLFVSKWFYLGAGHWRYTNESPFIGLLYKGIPLVGRFLIIAHVLALVLTFIPKLKRFRIYRTGICFILVAALIGPVGMVDSALKNHFGRARPAAVSVLGGERTFTPAFVPSNQCNKNCSFVSGHVATISFLMVIGWLSERKRRRWLLISAAAAAVIAWARIAVGAHFLSDTIFAWFAVYLGLWITTYLFRFLKLQPMPTRFDSESCASRHKTAKISK